MLTEMDGIIMEMGGLCEEDDYHGHGQKVIGDYHGGGEVKRLIQPCG
mgnify:FL=1|jgi:hypothetical protein